MTEMSDGAIVTDIDNHVDNNRLTSRGYTIRHYRDLAPRRHLRKLRRLGSAGDHGGRPALLRVGDEAGSARARLHPLRRRTKAQSSALRARYPTRVVATTAGRNQKTRRKSCGDRPTTQPERPLFCRR